MVTRPGLAVCITPRELPFGLIGAGGGTLAIWVGAPAFPVVALAFLVSTRVSVRRWHGERS